MVATNRITLSPHGRTDFLLRNGILNRLTDLQKFSKSKRLKYPGFFLYIFGVFFRSLKSSHLNDGTGQREEHGFLRCSFFKHILMIVADDTCELTPCLLNSRSIGASDLNSHFSTISHRVVVSQSLQKS